METAHTVRLGDDVRVDSPTLWIVERPEGAGEARFSSIADAISYAERREACLRNGYVRLCGYCVGWVSADDCPRCEGTALVILKENVRGAQWDYVGPAPVGFWPGMIVDLVTWEVVG